MQQPAVGETLKIDFDLFPTAASLALSASSPTQIETQTEIVTLTSKPPYPPSSPAAISASSSSAAVAAKSSHDKNIRVGVGVGAGVGGALAIAAVAIGLILARRRLAKRIESEQDARARWERENHAGMEQKTISNGQRWELGGDDGLIEADDGCPNEPRMLDHSTLASSGSPGTFSSSGGIDGGGGRGDRS